MDIREDLTIILKGNKRVKLSQLVNALDSLMFRAKLKDETDTVYNLRKLRYYTCFPVVDRGKLWYDDLSDEQYEELRVWRQKWLDVTETLSVPVTPDWVNKSLEGGTIL